MQRECSEDLSAQTHNGKLHFLLVFSGIVEADAVFSARKAVKLLSKKAPTRIRASNQLIDWIINLQDHISVVLPLQFISCDSRWESGMLARSRNAISYWVS